ncbi:helix-turn-helix domain-containing protein [Cellvibrio polysaccharolyticus]|uniref:XRE family transcriptional regulator n=1 Tax=Cellvibrio polysaccharolyticus TaxID=2082724 RepID=A0A928YRV8_9GAMM|nr:helix-turn-helix transcriptional regulator [Cellvibrio polysaccharolyticus]MBE8715736.1 XRE family transcriptional regulator [Cellvibrio polysaccharolyticus]
MEPLRKQFGRRVQRLRIEGKITQEQLADQVGVTIESISNIERGIHGPSFDNLEKIARALQVPVYRLFEFDHPDHLRPSD